MRKIGAWSVCFGTALAMAPEGFAQGSAAGGGDNADYFRRDRNTSVAERKRARDDGGGYLLVGGFRLSPTLTVMGGYSDNIGAAETNPTSASVVEADPVLDVRSDWGRHALNLSISAPTTDYVSNYALTDYLGSINGRIDVDHSAAIDFGVGYGDRVEPLGLADAGLALKRPYRYDVADAHVGVSKTFNRLRLAGQAQYQTTRYQDGLLTNGSRVSLDALDVDTTSYEVRADYAVTPGAAVFVSAAHNERDHRVQSSGPTPNVDSQGEQYLVGVNLDITHAVRGELAAEELVQSFDDPARPDERGLSVRGQLEWFPDPLVTVTMGVDREIQNSNSVDASTVVGTNADLKLEYEYRRNVDFNVGASYSHDAYNEIDRTDERWSVSAGAEYEINRTASLVFQVEHTSQTSDGVDQGRNYDANVALVGFRLRR